MPIQKLSLAISHYLARELNQPTSQPVLYYGLQVILGTFFKGGIIALAAYLLGFFTPTIAAVLAASFFRILSGGPHCTSYERCLITSLGVFLTLGYLGQLSQNMPNNFQINLWSSCMIILFIIVIRWAPGEHPQRTLTEKRKKLSKFLSLIFLSFLWGWAMVSFFWITGSPVFMSALFGLVWQGFSITPLGYLLMDTLDQWLTNITPKEVTS